MKLIEAMKKVKSNQAKIADLRAKIAKSSAHTSVETPEYGTNTSAKITEWLQAIHDLGQDNISLLVGIQRTNLVTNVTIEIAGKSVTKSISEWIWRRRQYAAEDHKAWASLTDRNIREGTTLIPGSQERIDLKIVRNFDPAVRDTKVEEYRNEPFEIDSALEVVNAVTDLIGDKVPTAKLTA